jgi:hypothetical protein
VTTTYLDPNGSGSSSSWNNNVNVHEAWDDAVRSPTNASSGGDGAHRTAFSSTSQGTTVLEFGTAAFGTVSEIKVWLYHTCSSASFTGKRKLTVQFGGVAQGDSGEVNFPAAFGWVSYTFTPGSAPSQADMDALQVKVEAWAGNDGVDDQAVTVYAVYVEVTHVPGGGTVSGESVAGQIVTADSAAGQVVSSEF